MIILPSLLLLTARHDGYHGAPSASYNGTAATSFVHLAGTNTACDSVLHSQSAVLSNTNAPTSMTASAMLPASSHSACRASYANVTSAESLNYGTAPSYKASSSVTGAWDELWSLHWPASSATHSSAAATTTTSTVNNSTVSVTSTAATPAIPFLTSRPARPSSTNFTDISVTTMSAITLSSIQNAFVDPGMFDPIIFDPGRLSSADAQTSTIHITVTASMPKATPITTMVKQSTITSQIPSTTTKSVKPSSFIQSASVSPFVSSSPPPPPPQSSVPPGPSSPYQSGDTVVRTSVISKDPRCPYPFPGVCCGDPKTTLITETRSGETSRTPVPTSKYVEDKPKESGSCPYPGMKC